MASTTMEPSDVYEAVRKHWGTFSPICHDQAYYATYAMTEITNYLWGALPDKTKPLNDELVMQLAQTLRFLGLTVSTLAPDTNSDSGGAHTSVNHHRRSLLRELLNNASDHAMQAGRILEQIRDLAHGVSDDAQPVRNTLTSEPAASGRPSPALTPSTTDRVVHPLVVDCRAIFLALGVDKLPSGALARSLSRRDPQRWNGMTRASLPGRLPTSIRPQRYANGKSLYMREHFFADTTDALPAPDFLPIVATPFVTYPQDSLPLDWLHDHWISRRPDAAHVALTEFIELLRINNAGPEWTKSGHFVQRAALRAYIPTSLPGESAAPASQDHEGTKAS